MDTLTICSVSFKSGTYLDLNWRLTKQLNPKTYYEWVVIENTPRDGSITLSETDERFRVLPAVEPPQVREKYRASYQHGAALNAVLAQAHTRFAVLLDPDLFIIQPNWIDNVISHMRRHSLAFFGVPYHPRWYRKYHDFPCAQALFVDFEQVPLTAMDYLPDLINNPTPPEVKIWLRFQQLCDESRYLRAAATLLRHLPAAWTEERAQRNMVSTSRDVGYRVHQQFCHNPLISSEIVQPVFRRGQDRLTPPGVTSLQLLPLVERLWPVERQYVPQRPNYFSTSGFREAGLVDLTAHDWEEFMWHKQPFAFHVRGYRQRTDAQTRAAPDISLILKSFTGLDTGIN